MLSTIRRRATYANVAATIALVFSMTGGALAASHYLITSKKQISPKVLKSLKGKTGARGATGPPGAPGVAGSAVAYGSVVVNGAGNPTFLSNSGFTGVTSPQSGVFCLTPSFSGHPLLVTPAGTQAAFSLVSAQKCPGGYQIETATTLTSGQGFVVSVP